MANVFLQGDRRDIETALLLEKAIVHDIGTAPAFTDGSQIYVNTDDNLFRILPNYNHDMLKWLLWHEQMHNELRHHPRFFKYKRDLETELSEKFMLSHREVNIIMDILVHDSMCKMFPELIEIARKNLAQMRDCNSLGYTFKTNTLEEMLEEYKQDKDPDKDGEGEGEPEGEPSGTGEEGEEGKSKDESEPTDKEPEEEEKKDGKTKHRKDGHGSMDKPKDKTPSKPELDPEDTEPTKEETEPEGHHDEVDWSKLEDIDDKEFIDRDESTAIKKEVERIKIKKFRLGKLTETLNGLATTTRARTYRTPSSIHVGKGVIMKGRAPGKTRLYLCFDASGSMGREMETFKEIINKSIPQAMDTPTTWFSGYCYSGSVAYCRDPEGRNSDYYKGKFKDFMKVSADSGYSDDGDRTIELCFKAEQLGYSPIGVTDGGGRISWSTDMLKQLKRTVLMGHDKEWLEEAQKINPCIQILDL